MPLESFPSPFSFPAFDPSRFTAPPIQNVPPLQPLPEAPPPTPEPVGTLTDIGRGFKRGLFAQTPQMLADAAKAFGGSAEWLRRYGKEQEQEPGQQVQPGGWGEAAANVVPALGTAALTFIPGIGEVAAPAAAAALFGGSQYTQTKEKLQGEGVDSDTARAAALGTGLVQGVGQAGLTYLGGKLLTGALGRVGTNTVQGGINSWASPGWIKPLAKGLGIEQAVQVPTQAAAAGAVAGIEGAAGAKDTPTALEAARESIGPTLMMTTLMAPFAGFSTLRINQARAAAARVIATPPPDVANLSVGQQSQWQKARLTALGHMYTDISKYGETEAMAWRKEAENAIYDNQPVSLDVNWKYERPTPETQPAQIDTTGAFPVPPWAEGMGLEPTGTQDPLAMGRSAREAAAAASEDVTGGAARAQYEQQGFAYPPPPEVPTPMARFAGMGRVEHAPMAAETRDPFAMGGMGELPEVRQAGEEATRQALDAEERAAFEARRTAAELPGPTAMESAFRQAQWDAANRQRRAQELKAAMPVATRGNTGVLSRLTGKDGPDLAAEVRKIWAEKIDAKNPPKYLTELEAFHEKLTGKKLEDVLAEERATDEAARSTAEDTGKGAEPQPAAVAAGAEAARVGEQVHEGAGHGAAEPTATTESEAAAPVAPGVAELKGAADATQAGVQPEGRVAEHTGVEGQREEPPPQAGGGNRAGERSQDGTWRGDAAAVSAAEEQVTQAKAALDAKQQELLGVRRQLSQLNNDIFRNPGRQPTEEQAALRESLHTQQDQLLSQRDQLDEFTKHSAAVGTAERARAKTEPREAGGKEPAETPEYWRKPVDPNSAIDAHTDIMHAWLTTLENLGKITPEQKAAMKAMEGKRMGARYRPTQRSLEEQRAAHEDMVKSGQDKRLNRMVDEWHKAYEFAKEKGVFAKSVEAADRIAEQRAAESQWRMAIAAAEEGQHEELRRLEDAVYQQSLRQISRDVKAGKITQAEADRRYAAAAEKQVATFEVLQRAVEKAQADMEALNNKGRGIAGLSDPALRARVKANPSALATMADFARRNNSPVLRGIARMLANERLTANIVEIENPDFKGGRYVPATDTIEIGHGGMNTLTLMHEATHALTHKMLAEAIDNAKQAFDSLTKPQQEGVSALREVRGLMDRFSKIGDWDDPAHRLAMKDEHEFVSEALNNPSIQAALDSRNWLTKLYHKLFNALPGVTPKMSAEMEQLARTSSVFFGDPDAASKEIYNRDPQFGGMSRWFNSLASVSPKMAFGEALLKGDVPAALFKEALGWMTHNHATQMLSRYMQRLARQYPQYESIFKAVDIANSSYRQNKSAHDTVTSMMVQEGNRLNLRNTRYQSLFPKMAEKLFNMMSESTRLGYDAGAKTFEEAKKRNPDLKLEDWNSAKAQLLRATHAMLERESARLLKEDPKADTPIKIYNDTQLKHSLDSTRSMTNAVKTALDTFELHDHPTINAVRMGKDKSGRAYDRLDILANPYFKMGIGEQQLALHKTIYDIGDVVNKALAEKLGIGEKEVDKAYSLLKEKGAVPKDMVDFFAARSDINDIVGQYAKQQRIPYFHIGRSGEYVVKFTVGGGDKEWDRVGAIVGADVAKGGLERGWGPPKDDNRDVYMRFEDEKLFREAEEKLLPLQKEGLFNHPETGQTTWAAGRAAASLRQIESASPRFMHMLENRINAGDYGEHGEEIKRDLINNMKDAYIASLPESSPLKASMFRDGDVGYSKDFVNTLADRLTMSMKSVASSYTSPLMARTLKDLHNARQGLDRTPGMGKEAAKVGLYIDEVRKRMSEMTRPTQSPVLDRARSFAASYRLALAPAYMLMIGYQPLQITYPFIAKRYGFVDTGAAMIRNYGKAISILNALLKMGWADPNMQGLSKFDKIANMAAMQFEFGKIIDKKTGLPALTGNDLAAMEALQRSNLLNFGQTNQVARLNPEDRSVMTKTMNLVTVAPHYIEVLNRMVAMLTAHEMATTKGGLTPEEAQKYGLQIVRDTDGDHSQANIARRLGRKGFAGPFTPNVVGFGQFDIQMTETLLREIGNAFSPHSTSQERREAFKALGGLSATTALMAGTLSLPFVSLFTGVANQVLSWSRDKNDDPPDVQGAWRELMAGIFGKKGGEIVSRGVPRAFDMDMSVRSGLSDLAPFSDFLSSRRKIEDKLSEGGLALLGPAVGVGAGMWTGSHALYEHNYPKFINDALPAEVRNLAKAYRLAKYGYESMSPGNQILPIPVTDWNIAMQAMGVQGSARAETAEKAYAYHTHQELLQNRQEVIRNDIYRAQDHGDYHSMADAMQQSMDFFMRHPYMGFGNVGAGISQRAMTRETAEISGTGILAPMRQYPTLQPYQRY